MEPYIEIILEDKIYNQRTPNSKFVKFSLNGIKEESFDILPTEIKKLVNIVNEMEDNPKRYFDYSIQNDYIVIHRIKNIDTPYVKIPEYIEGLPVGVLDSNVCEQVKETIRQIQLPSTMRQFSKNTFAECKKLEYINIPESIWFIPQKCFISCTALKEINLENIKEIKSEAFRYCSDLRKIKFKKLENIGEYAFAECKSLKQIIIDSNLKSIPRACFATCTNLEELQLPNSIEAIDAYAFQSCRYLEEFIAPKNLKIIAKLAFFQNNFSKIILNDELESIGDRTFESFTNVKTKVLINKNTKYYKNSFHQNSIITEVNKNKINQEER